MKRIITKKKLSIVAEQLRILTSELGAVAGGRPRCSWDDSGCLSKVTTAECTPQCGVTE